MKITTFNPQIVTENDEPVIKLMEELGFEVKHSPKGIGEFNVSGTRMKDGNGFHIDISQVDHMPAPHDMVAIRMNVDNFDEAYELLVSHGFKNFYGDKVVDRETSKSAMMISPSGFAINLIYHVKD